LLEQKVLFATDLEGDTSDIDAGLQLATRLARERAATLIILHVVPIDSSQGEANLYRAADLVADRPRRSLERLIPADSGVPFRHVLEVGNPEQRIAEVVERERVGLLVLETRKRTTLSQLLGRSLVERLAQRVPCPVLSYRAANLVHDDIKSVTATKPPSPESLSRLLDTRVNALLTWLHLQREAARSVAEQRSIRDAVGTLCRQPPDRAFIPAIRSMLELELNEHQRALGALGVAVVQYEARETLVLQLGESPRRDFAYAEYLSHLHRDGTATSVPLEGASELGAPNGLILAGARVTKGAYVVFALDARRDFLRILAQPGPAPTIETYAFDEHGMMLSDSRFPDQLRRMGLLPAEPGVQTARRLRICDPARLAGEFMPLTRMAAAATAGEDGCDWTGYRDYRGVEVIGAWRWLPDYGFGVAAEMDRLQA
jgi:nucleotide-binding universal stress UspA family protein